MLAVRRLPRGGTLRGVHSGGRGLPHPRAHLRGRLVRGNAVKAPLVLGLWSLALPIFAAGGLVAWLPGIALGCGAVVGALVGVRRQIAEGHAWVRWVVSAAVVLFAIRLLTTV